MISSTSEDLVDHRAAVAEVIESASVLPQRMETWPLAPHTPVAESLRRVRESDVVIVLAAFRFGWVPTKEEGGDGIRSITQMEYDLAVELDKNVMVLLAATDGWTYGRDSDDEWNDGLTPERRGEIRAAVELQSEFRRVLAGRYRAEFRSPKDAALRVSQSLPQFLPDGREPSPPVAGRNDRKVLRSGTPPVVVPTRFTGRDAEIAEIVEFLRSDSAVAVLTGRAGSGKSTTACKGIAEATNDAELELAAEVYVGARDTGGLGLARIAEALAEVSALGERILGAWQDQASVPMRVHELLGAFSDQRVALLLDNIETELGPASALRDPEVATFLKMCATQPGHRLKVLITTRTEPRDFSLPDVSWAIDRINLGAGLEQSQASMLIDELARQYDIGSMAGALKERVYGVTGGNPRALWQLLYSMSEQVRSADELLEYVESVGSEQIGEILLGHILVDESHPSRFALGALAALGRPTAYAQLADVLDDLVSEDELSETIPRLMRDGLVQRVDDLYRLHPADERVLLNEIPEGGPQDWQYGSPSFTLAAMRHRAALAFLEMSTEADEWTTLADSEPMREAVRLFIDSGDVDMALEGLADLVDVLDQWGYLGMLVDSLSRTRNVAPDDMLGPVLLTLASAYRSAGDDERALAALQEVTALGDDAIAAAGFLELSRMEWRAESEVEARRHAERAVELAVRAGDRSIAVQALVRLSDLALRADDPEIARDGWASCLARACNLSRVLIEMRLDGVDVIEVVDAASSTDAIFDVERWASLTFVSEDNASSGDDDFIDLDLSMWQILDDPDFAGANAIVGTEELADLWMGGSEVALRLGDRDVARKRAELAGQMFARLGDDYSYARATRWLASLEESSGPIEAESLDLMRGVIKVKRDEGRMPEVVLLQIELGHALREARQVTTAQLDEARRCYEDALAIAETVPTSNVVVADAIQGMGLVAWAEEEYGRAIELLDDAAARLALEGDEMAVQIARRNIALIRSRSGARGAAVSELRQVLREITRLRDIGEQVTTLVALSSTLRADRRFDAALSQAELAVTLASGSGQPTIMPEAINELARAYAALGRTEDARRAMDRALVAASETGFASTVIEASTAVGEVADELEMFDVAIVAIGRGLEVAKSIDDVDSTISLLGSLSGVQISLRNYAEATTLADEAWRLATERGESVLIANARVWQAQAWARAGQTELAVGYAREAVRADPKWAGYAGTLGWVLYLHGDYQASIEWSTKALELDRATVWVLVNRGLAATRAEDLQAARAYFRETVERRDLSYRFTEDLHELETIASEQPHLADFAREMSDLLAESLQPTGSGEPELESALVSDT